MARTIDKKKVLANVGLLVAGLASSFSDAWGPNVHSVIAIAFGLVAAAHVFSHRKWLKAMRRRWRNHPERRLALYNTVFAAVLTTCLISGFPVWFGTTAGGLGAVHGATGIAFVVMIPGHLILNRHRIRAFIGRRRNRPAPG